MNNIDKLKTRVDDILNRQVKHLEKMYTNANVSLEDKLMSMENNIFKLTFAFITQLCVIFFMWLF